MIRYNVNKNKDPDIRSSSGLGWEGENWSFTVNDRRASSQAQNQRIRDRDVVTKIEDKTHKLDGCKVLSPIIVILLISIVIFIIVSLFSNLSIGLLASIVGAAIMVSEIFS